MDLVNYTRIMEEIALSPKKEMGRREPGEYQASEPYYKMVNTLSWALKFLQDYEKKTKRN